MKYVDEQLKIQKNTIYEDRICPFIYPSISLKEFTIHPRLYNKSKFRNNFYFSEQHTLKHLTDLAIMDDSSLLRPFCQRIFDNEFIRRTKDNLKAYGYESEKWYVDFGDIVKKLR